MGVIDFKVSTAPTSEPITTAEAKEFMGIDYSDHDTMIDTFIQAAREWAEKYTGRAFITQTLIARIAPITEEIYLPYPPIGTISEVLSTWQDDEETLTNDSDYFLVGDQDKHLEMAAFGTSSNAIRRVTPEVFADRELKVTYTAGYGAAAAVPEAIKLALKIIVKDSYDCRNLSPSEGAKMLLDKYKVYGL